MRIVFGSAVSLALVLAGNGAVPDLEAWARSFDYGAILGVIDSQ